jgi:hypothetical protein
MRNDNGKPSLFGSNVRRLTSRSSKTKDTSLDSLSHTNFESTSSFRYENYGTGIKSTQQIPLDWSKFENHTFFNSAESKINIAFDNIINHFPFDGTEKENQEFMDSLTGFEKWVFDSFPKNVGFLMFEGETLPSKGTYIEVKDSPGAKYPILSKPVTGESVLDPNFKSFTFDMQLFSPKEPNENQIVCQRIGSKIDKGMTLAISKSDSSEYCNIILSVASGTIRTYISSSIEKGKFNHICASFDRRENHNNLKIYIDSLLVATSSNILDIGTLTFDNSSLYIGDGSSVLVKNNGSSAAYQFVPVQTLSGAIDEFRFYHKHIGIKEQKRNEKKTVYASDPLALHFRFNEPFGEIGSNRIVLDTSGNSLHSNIENYTATLRATGSIANPLKYEDRDLSPILFPKYKDVISLNSTLMATGSDYDKNNPNLITRLIPRHYLESGQEYEGLSTTDGGLSDAFSGGSIPKTGKSGHIQLMSSILFFWAKYFDEMKIFLDHISVLTNVDYDVEGDVVDQFLPFVADYYGFDLPNFFKSATIEQFVAGENVLNLRSGDYNRSNNSLKYIQSQLWRRILSNINDVKSSKGTIHSIKSIIRSSGINPDGLFRIREYGGTVQKTTKGMTQQRVEVSTLLDLSASIGHVGGTEDAQGFSLSGCPHISSPFLTSSRLETGFPLVVGSFVNKNSNLHGIHGISDSIHDGLHTSGSWSFESHYRFQEGLTYNNTQSLARLHVTGAALSSPLLHTNLVVTSGSDATVELYTRPTSALYGSNSPYMKLFLTGVDMFDGEKWYVSFGRQRGDHKDLKTSVSSSYFLRAIRQNFGQIKEEYFTSSMYQESYTDDGSNVLQSASSQYNASGSFIIIGSQSLGSSTRFLHDTSNIPNISRETKFEGRVGHIRFWSKYLTDTEWRQHAINFKSLGTDSPKNNFNFSPSQTGSFEKLRIDVSTDQIVTKSNGEGILNLVDFSQNGMDFTASGFEKNKGYTIRPETFYYSFLSPSFDILQSENKVRVRGFLDSKNFDLAGYASTAPVTYIPPNHEAYDDVRLSVDFSVVDTLNEDIINLFSSLDFFDDSIGSPNLVFSETYPDLEQMQKIYFNRLTEKINIKSFFEFFKWFDSVFEDLIYQVIPRKTSFMGVNFVIESHMLERHKMRYGFDQQWLTSTERDNDKGDLTLSQFAGSVKRF